MPNIPSQDIPEDFPRIYASDEERMANWIAFNNIKAMTKCPEYLSYRDANKWIITKLEAASLTNNIGVVFK